ncbi:glutamate receptor ionotropic, NMDA 2C [Trichonephila clavata]|uniref:Glutamate receptor ionotropic, NMDA 2C n=1 Tax=Trichonephila clavata TaxID=2740835 RepID=A0A8X6HEV9_TRICU|nr:glutamate receptor ionotropic, NMDA 2C [Trichonephila clavata]
MDFPSNLVVATIPQEYIFQINQESDLGEIHLSGVDGRLLNIISNALKFQYILTIPPDLEFGRKTENGNFTGMVGMVYRGEADIALGQLTITEERSEVVDFSIPYTNQDETFLIKKPGLLPTTWAIFRPFGIYIWILILIMFLTIPILHKKLLKVQVSYLRLYLQFYGSIVGKAFPLSDGSFKTRILLLVWGYFALIISNSYSAALLSFLTLPLNQRSVNNFEELSDAVRQGTHLCFAMQGLSVPDLHTLELEYLRFLGNAIDKNKWYLDPSKMISENQLSETTAIVDLRFMLQLLDAGLSSDSYMISDDTLFSWKIAIAVKKNFCCKDRLDLMINRILSAGLFYKFLRDELLMLKISTNKTFSNAYKVRKLSIRDTGGAWSLLFVGYTISFVVFAGENVIARLQFKIKKSK